MKRIKKPTLHKTHSPLPKAEEPLPAYPQMKPMPALKDFTYSEFKKTADKVPFTIAEWATILHVSERTLQRYAKSNGKFAPINAERFQQINQLLAKGKKVFGKTEYFYEWLHSNPPTLSGDISIQSLTSFDGIQKVLTQLGRLEYGILA